MPTDKTCLVWGKTCSGTGNCWLYNGETLRYLLNFTAASKFVRFILEMLTQTKQIFHFQSNKIIYQNIFVRLFAFMLVIKTSLILLLHLRINRKVNGKYAIIVKMSKIARIVFCIKYRLKF